MGGVGDTGKTQSEDDLWKFLITLALKAAVGNSCCPDPTKRVKDGKFELEPPLSLVRPEGESSLGCQGQGGGLEAKSCERVRRSVIPSRRILNRTGLAEGSRKDVKCSILSWSVT